MTDALAGAQEPVVLLSDGLDEAGQQAVAVAVRASGRMVVEVRSARWDGETQSQLSAACRGVISGFGGAGVAAAVALIQREAAG
jgi:3-dehydroquinate dehydratase